MNINASGYVGVGTDNPKNLLHVGSGSATDPIAAAAQCLIMGNNQAFGGTPGNLCIQSTDVQDADKGGMLGFAGERQDNQSGALVMAAIAGRKENNTNANYAGYLHFATRANGANLTEKMRITSAGLVGIGTTAPSNNVEIYDTADAALLLNTDSGADWAGVCFERQGTLQWKIYLGGASANNLTIADAGLDDGMYMAQGASDWTDVSDERLKTSITPIENAIDKLNAFQAVNFKWKYGSEEKRTKNNIGFLAQEVNEVVPEAVDSHDNEDFKLVDHPVHEGQKQAQGSWGVRKTVLIPVLVKAVQELSAEVKELKKEIEELKK